MSDVPPNGLSATEASEKIRQGWLTSVELTTACLNRIEETDGQLKAWVHVDREGALARAEELDKLRFAGKPLGPLHGLPVALKDIIDAKGMTAELGSPIFKGRMPESDAKIVERLHEAGAVIIGKTATTEFAFVHPAETCNPHNLEHSPGGSSSGSAAAVAGFHVPLAIGTQTNGSVIRPASFCGTYGFKPTRGVIPRTGVLQTSISLDQVGVFARSLDDVALLADALAIYDPSDATSYARARPQMAEGAKSEPPVDPDLVWLELPFLDRLNAEATEAMEEVVSALGDRVERIEAPPYFADLIETQRTIHEYEICQHLAETFDKHWDQVSSTLQPVVKHGQAISQDEYDNAIGVMGEVGSFFEEFFMDFDAVLAPSSAGVAPLRSDGHTGDPVFSTIWTLAGLPCLTLPLLTSSAGLPIGIQLIGGQEEDDRLLRTASWMLNELS
ncbi:MAG: amidase [Hyphomicrobiales bacterium]